jgi:tRNA-modifying protein YgfZ
MASAALLEDRAVIALSGGETRDFLQGLISNDMAGCTPGHAIYAGLLTPQGKILFDFFVLERGGAFLLDCADERAADLAKRIAMYRLRAKVEIVQRPDLAVAAMWGDGLVDSTLAFADPRLPALGLRVIGPRGDVAKIAAGIPSGDYAAHRVSLGVPDSADLPPDTVLALDAGFEELNGVNFKKGCYVGQEVTARMKHRATARKRFVIADSLGALPPFGTPLQAQEKEVGTLAGGKGTRALALVRLDRVAEAQSAGAVITGQGEKIVLHKPAWLTV